MYEARLRHVRLFPLQVCQCRLDLAVLGVLAPDVIVDAGSFLRVNQSQTRDISRYETGDECANLLQQINQLPQRLVRPVLDLVPRERPQVLINGLFTAP